MIGDAILERQIYTQYQRDVIHDYKGGIVLTNLPKVYSRPHDKARNTADPGSI